MNCANNKGFTLLELLLAMAIFTLVSLSGYSIINTMVTADGVSKKKLARLNKIQTAFIVLERDIIQLSRRHIRIEGDEPLSGFLHSGEGNFSGNVESLLFVRAGWSNPNLVLPRGDLQAVKYQLNGDVFERSHFNYVDAAPGEKPKIRPLLDKVESLIFEFYYKNKWQQELVANKIPKGIAVEISTQDLGTIRRQFLVAGDND